MKPEEVLEQVVAICMKHGVSQIILYGSRAKNTYQERSDIDIAVSGADDFEQLADEVKELPTLYTVDLLNMDECRNTLLLEDIRQYGRKIFEKV